MGRLWVSRIVWIAVCCIAARASAADHVPSTQDPPPALNEELFSTRRMPRLSTQTSRFPGNVTVITAEEIKRSGATTIQDVLRRLEGVTFSDQQGFGLGSDSTVNLRGIVNSSRTNALVLLDGVRQNRITGDDVHWQSIPVDQIERIEVIRGPAGLMYGEGALGGVINILTKHDSQRLLESEEGAEVGSFGWQRYYANVRGRQKAVRYGTNYTRQFVTGYRESSKARATTVTAHGGVDLAPWLSTDVSVLHSEDTTGFPGLLTLAQSQQRQEQTNSFHGLNDNETDQVSLDLRAGPWEGVTGLVNFFWRRRLQFSEDSINFNAFTVTPSHGLNLRTDYAATAGSVSNLLVSGVELGEDKATTGDPGAGPDSESNRAGYGLYLEDTLTFYERVSLIVGVRYDRSRYEESLTFPAFDGTLRFQGWSPKIGISVSAIPDTLDVFASYARPFKAPNVDDFSSRLGSSFSGNADLKPQQGNSFELGTRFTRAPFRAGITGFYTFIDREILLNSLALPFQTNENFDTRRYGVELSGRYELPDRVRLYANYTVIDATFHEGQFSGNTIPGTPRQTLNAGAGVSPIHGCWIDLDWSVVNDFFRVNDLENRLGKADNYGVLNLLAQYEVPQPKAWHPLRSLRVYFKIENITNEEYNTYQSSNGTTLAGAGEAPMPPTSFIGGFNLAF
ncbi:MAG: TonB-dependent receptor [Candidatus Omnitrophica bacterium]|nr:TonB-dependent receptor [Candidatus Omnitrophota bacterium]